MLCEREGVYYSHHSFKREVRYKDYIDNIYCSATDYIDDCWKSIKYTNHTIIDLRIRDYSNYNDDTINQFVNDKDRLKKYKRRRYAM